MVGPTPGFTVTVFEILLEQPQGSLRSGCDEEDPGLVAVRVTVQVPGPGKT